MCFSTSKQINILSAATEAPKPPGKVAVLENMSNEEEAQTVFFSIMQNKPQPAVPYLKNLVILPDGIYSRGGPTTCAQTLVIPSIKDWSRYRQRLALMEALQATQ